MGNLNKLSFDQIDNSYTITSRKAFMPLGKFGEETLLKSIDFAYGMSFGNQGAHRVYRSGGSIHRSSGEIFSNTFQGKLSEFALYGLLKDKFEINEPDLSCYQLGAWDEFDFKIGEKIISIKSTKSFGNLLLLEQKDWNSNAEYIPNIELGNATYDFIFLVRIKPNCEEILKTNQIMDSLFIEKDKIANTLLGVKWEIDVPGFITTDQLKYIIENKFIIPKGSKLNRRVNMDATNYYVQAGDLNDLEDFYKYMITKTEAK